MRPEFNSRRLLGITRAKAKMYEFHVPENEHIDIPRDPARLFSLAIGLLGDLSVRSRVLPANHAEIEELRTSLAFAARFFDAYLSSHLNDTLDPYLLLLGSSAYYLCGLPGSASVLAGRLGQACPDIGGGGCEEILYRLLTCTDGGDNEPDAGQYHTLATRLCAGLREHSRTGGAEEDVLQIASETVAAAYGTALPRHILLADVSHAVLQRRLANSVWHSVPRYSELSREVWLPVFAKPSFMRELWPAQHLLGGAGIYRGVSAVVQMPTSAGKTKATEIIIRSAFLSGRTSLAIIVAPYRALCHEIHNSYARAFRGEPVSVSELSDVPQEDFDVGTIVETRTILVLTPEKLLYVLRHNPELANHVGLLLYDEGHQFDTGGRGVTYELLTTALARMIPEHAQVVLISAVISNAEAIAEWMGGGRFVVVSGTRLSPTPRTVGFANWPGRRGRLEFVREDDPDEIEFFVPRVIESHTLALRGREVKPRVFPNKGDSGSIAAYLGLTLVSEGSVAIFCGTRATASALCADIADAYSRDLALNPPSRHADERETARLAMLHESHLGSNADATQAARLGVFAHHGNTPHGLRLAIEYAMQQGLAKFVVCTSTLAQGVNLPIRYLVVRSLYQGKERIKIRDFQNLIGRAGRSGMHTEGSILFAEPAIFETRRTRGDDWRWTQAKELLVPENAEPCASSLLAVLEPLTNDDGSRHLKDRLRVAKSYVSGDVDALASRLAEELSDRGYSADSLSGQVRQKKQTISAIESYLMAHGDEDGQGLGDESVDGLAQDTLAYFLADEEERKLLIELFRLLASHILQVVPERGRRRAIGKTLLGVRESAEIERWVQENVRSLLQAEGIESLLSLLWPVFFRNIHNPSFSKCNMPEILLNIGLGWIRGTPFHGLLNELKDSGARIGGGQRPRHPTIDHVVDMCENALGYEGNLLVGAIIEIVTWIIPDGPDALVAQLQLLQKRLKYGVASEGAMTLYEIGFADRVIATELAAVIGTEVSTKRQAREALRQNPQGVVSVLDRFPTYFRRRYEYDV